MINQAYRNHMGMFRLHQILKVVQNILAIAFIVCLLFIPFLSYSTVVDEKTYNLKFSVFDELKITFNHLRDNNFVFVDLKSAISLIVLVLGLLVLAYTLIMLIVKTVKSIINIISIDNSTLLAYHDVVMAKGKIVSCKNDLLNLFIAMLLLVSYYFIQFKVQAFSLSDLINAGLNTEGISIATTCLTTLTNINPLIVVLGGILLVYIITIFVIAFFSNKMKLNILKEKCEENYLAGESL